MEFSKAEATWTMLGDSSSTPPLSTLPPPPLFIVPFPWPVLRPHPLLESGSGAPYCSKPLRTQFLSTANPFSRRLRSCPGFGSPSGNGPASSVVFRVFPDNTFPRLNGKSGSGLGRSRRIFPALSPRSNFIFAGLCAVLGFSREALKYLLALFTIAGSFQPSNVSDTLFFQGARLFFNVVSIDSAIADGKAFFVSGKYCKNNGTKTYYSKCEGHLNGKVVVLTVGWRFGRNFLEGQHNMSKDTILRILFYSCSCTICT